MKTIYITILACLVIAGSVFGQMDHLDRNYGLNYFEVSRELVHSTEVVTRECIVMKPGFSTKGHDFSARIDNSIYISPELNSTKYSLRYTVTPQVPVKNIRQLVGKPGGAVVEEINYFDGGRRLIQEQERKGAYNQVVAKSYTYNSDGRIDKVYQPIVDKGLGGFVEDLSSKTDLLYKEGIVGVEPDSKAYTVYDYYPSGSTKSVTGPGEDWLRAGKVKMYKSTSYKYEVNLEKDNLPILEFSSGRNVVVKNGVYPDGWLRVSEAMGEDGRVTKTYADFTGTALFFETNGQRTALIYDELQRLRVVVPPLGYEELSTSGWTLVRGVGKWEKLCYEYVYDDQGRLVEKVLPNAGRVEMVYNGLNQMIFFRDARMAERGVWYFRSVDALGRLAYSGVYLNSNLQRCLGISDASRSEVQRSLGDDDYAGYSRRSENGWWSPYTDLVKPDTIDVEVVYDEYPVDFVNPAKPTTPVDAAAETYFSKSGFGCPLGLATEVRERIVSSDKFYNGKMQVTRYGYNDKGQVAYTEEVSPMGSVTVTPTYDFIGRVVTEAEKVVCGVKSVSVDRKYTYGSNGSLSSVDQRIDGQSMQRVAEYKYNGLGMLVERDLHGRGGSNDYAERLSYRYNVRGWLRNIGDINGKVGLFAMELAYNQGLDLLGGAKRYDGSVAGMRWRTNDGTVHGYGYSYDSQDRLVKAEYGSGSDLQTNRGRYNEELDYDLGGGVKLVKRMGCLQQNPGAAASYGVMDDVAFTLNGNQAVAFSDNADVSLHPEQVVSGAKGALQSFGYDVMGCIVKDASRDITNVHYSYHGFPLYVQLGVPSGRFNTHLSYTYTASGQKLQSVWDNGRQLAGRPSGRTTCYLGSATIVKSEIVSVATAEGRAVNNGGSWQYEYMVTDHQGNVRVSFKPNAAGGNDITAVNHYYPYGLSINGLGSYAANGGLPRYGFGGKELDELQNLYWLDFDARRYNPALCQWSAPDPLQEKYADVSPYSFCLGNPVNNTDPSGADVIVGANFIAFTGDDISWALSALLSDYNGFKKSLNSMWAAQKEKLTSYRFDKAVGGYAKGDGSSEEYKLTFYHEYNDEVVPMHEKNVPRHARNNETVYGVLTFGSKVVLDTRPEKFSKPSTSESNINFDGVISGAASVIPGWTASGYCDAAFQKGNYVEAGAYFLAGSAEMYFSAASFVDKAISDALTPLASRAESFFAKEASLATKSVVSRSSVLTSASSTYKGSTVLGHALSKHAGRNPSIWGKLTGNPSTWHNQALKHFDDIMNAAGGFTKTRTQQGINFLEKRLPDGRGIRLNMDGTFKGFID